MLISKHLDSGGYFSYLKKGDFLGFSSIPDYDSASTTRSTDLNCSQRTKIPHTTQPEKVILGHNWIWEGVDIVMFSAALLHTCYFLGVVPLFNSLAENLSGIRYGYFLLPTTSLCTCQCAPSINKLYFASNLVAPSVVYRVPHLCVYNWYRETGFHLFFFFSLNLFNRMV